MTTPPKDSEVHIASFVVQHRKEAAGELAAAIAGCTALDLAVAGEFRSIVLCESDDQYALIDHIETLRAIPGVLNVSLVYHHAEPRDALEAQMTGIVPTGA